MIEQGRGGKIINVASQAGRRGEPLVLTYCASKATVISMTQSMALALAPHKINVNAIAPGIVDTPLWESNDRRFAELLGMEVVSPSGPSSPPSPSAGSSSPRMSLAWPPSSPLPTPTTSPSRPTTSTAATGPARLSPSPLSRDREEGPG
jgi:NAD(P)-dependent dehydrogenase (short-subunit alcohol dehydrogenase family)